MVFKSVGVTPTEQVNITQTAKRHLCGMIDKLESLGILVDGPGSVPARKNNSEGGQLVPLGASQEGLKLHPVAISHWVILRSIRERQNRSIRQ